MCCVSFGVQGVGFISEKLEESLSETLSLVMPVRFLPGFTGMTAVSSNEGVEKVLAESFDHMVGI